MLQYCNTRQAGAVLQYCDAQWIKVNVEWSQHFSWP